jgi:hypothetical protein
MAIAVNDIIAAVRNILLDPAGVRWPTAELVDWISHAQRDIAARKPDATATTATVLLVQGTRQTLPSAAQRLIDVTRNTNSDGTAPGRAIKLVDRVEIDSAQPNWHSTAATGGARHTNIVKNYTYSENDPRTYHVFPGVKDADTVYATIVYSITPAAAVAGQNLSIADYYAEAVTNYVLYRAYMKESEFGGSNERVQLQLQLFLSAVGEDIKVAKVSSPNARRLGTEGNRS